MGAEETLQIVTFAMFEPHGQHEREGGKSQGKVVIQSAVGARPKTLDKLDDKINIKTIKPGRDIRKFFP